MTTSDQPLDVEVSEISASPTTNVQKSFTRSRTESKPLLNKILDLWSQLLYILMAGMLQIFFIELYCRWHGSYFISLNLYTPLNVNILSRMTFVNGPTTMSVAAEVLMWSSLGVWANNTYNIARNLSNREPNFPRDVSNYIATMVRNTSVAATVIILLRLTKFSIFSISLDESSPLSFDATIGLSFLLGFFGDEAYLILSNLKDRIMGAIGTSKQS